MAILKLIKYPNPILKEVSTPVTEFDSLIKRILNDMLESMHYYKGIGLAAIQIGIKKRMLVMDLRNADIDAECNMHDKPYFIVNPKIIESSKIDKSFTEGCLSFPGASVEITRPAYIILQYQNENGKLYTTTCTGLAATCIQHEIDHLDGITIPNRVKSPIQKEVFIKKVLKNIKDDAN